jgi:hypothetical protein
MLQRPYMKLHQDMCTYAKYMNKPIWVDYDDNLFALNPENRAFQTYNDPETQECVKSILKMADVVSVPTEYLRQVYTPYNKNIEVIPNAHNDLIQKRGILKSRIKSVVWRGPDAHIYDLMTYGKEINVITAEFPEWDFVFMGYYPWFLSESKNKGFLPALDIIMYFKKLSEIAPTVMHILLHDNLFNRCRSNVAYLEGTFAGAMCVVPSWWNVPGALSYSNGEEYTEAMRTALKGEVDTLVQNKIAWEYIQDCLLLSKINVERVNLINGLI